MITIQVLGEWAVRSSILIACGALVLRVLRVKDSAVRLAAWTAILIGSVAIPLLTTAPKIPVNVMPAAPPAMSVTYDAPSVISKVAEARFDWPRAAMILYSAVAGAVLLRLFAGLWMSRRLLWLSDSTGLVHEGIEVRASDRVAAPVTLGVVRSAILLPVDWREWEAAKLDAVLAHELSHIRRYDPAVQMLSAMHRALLWFSPLSWFLHRRIVQVSEEASDDAAVLTAGDRASYAEILLYFMQRGMRGANWHGIAMARYGRPDRRIHRILDEPSLSRGMTRWSMAAVLALASPLVYLVATAHPQAASGTIQEPAPIVIAQAQPATGAHIPEKSSPARIRNYMIFSGSQTVSGSWNSNDREDQQELRERFGNNFVWLRQGADHYVITNAAVLAELDEAMKPQQEVNKMQEGVNDQQNVVNQQQEKVNQAQEEVNLLQERANHRQELINQLQAAKKDDELIKELERALAELRTRKDTSPDQDTVNAAEFRVNEMQHKVNDAQHVVNEMQHKVNEAQHRVSDKLNGRIDEILQSAIRRGVAERLK